MSFRSTLLALLLSLPALAADAVSQARAEVQRHRAEAAALRERQHALRVELNAAGDRIAELKAAARGKLLRQDALDAELKRSQALSGELTGIAARIAEADASATLAQQAVVDALTAELSLLRADFERSTDREHRRQLISQMRTVRDERERYEAALPRSSAPALSTAASDDPEDLLQQADALRDSRDKVARRLEAVRRRVRELEQERELDRRMSQFVQEESLFDEHDRRLGRFGDGRMALADEFSEGGTPVAVPSTSGGGQSGPTSPSPERFRDPNPQLGAPAPDDLRALQAEAKRLEEAAAELERRAVEAERRALELR